MRERPKPGDLCEDCQLPLTEQNIHVETEPEMFIYEHRGICCDCDDERSGMPPENRSRPRPVGAELLRCRDPDCPDGPHEY